MPVAACGPSRAARRYQLLHGQRSCRGCHQRSQTEPKNPNGIGRTSRKRCTRIFDSIEDLKDLADQKRQFTIDGRLVGDIGEFVASMDYALTLHETSKPGYDGETFDKRSVRIEATFRDHLTYRSRCELYLGLKFRKDGTYEEVYNGPARLIHQRFKHRKGIGS